MRQVEVAGDDDGITGVEGGATVFVGNDGIRVTVFHLNFHISQ